MPKITILNRNKTNFLNCIILDDSNGINTVSCLTTNITNFTQLQKFLQRASIPAGELGKALPVYVQTETEPDYCYNIKLSKQKSVIAALECLLKNSTGITGALISITSAERKNIENFLSTLIDEPICSDSSSIELKTFS